MDSDKEQIHKTNNSNPKKAWQEPELDARPAIRAAGVGGVCGGTGCSLTNSRSTGGKGSAGA